MKIVMIGAGNVATHLCLALSGAGNDILQVFSRNIENAVVLADRVGAEAVNDLKMVRGDADVYVISVKDDAIKDTARILASRMNENAMLLHTAGSVSINVLSHEWKRSAVLYPMQTFSKVRDVNFRKVPCFVEGTDESTLRDVSELAMSISEKVQVADSEQRKYMHLAAVFACNITNHCYRLAEKIVEEHGLDFSMFLPLILETARKLEVMKPKDAQTGPMARNDHTVMEAQKSLLHDERMRDIYTIMADSIREDFTR